MTHPTWPLSSLLWTPLTGRPIAASFLLTTIMSKFLSLQGDLSSIGTPDPSTPVMTMQRIMSLLPMRLLLLHIAGCPSLQKDPSESPLPPPTPLSYTLMLGKPLRLIATSEPFSVLCPPHMTWLPNSTLLSAPCFLSGCN